MFILVSWLVLNPGNILPNPSFEEWLDTTVFDTIHIYTPQGWITSEFLYPGSAVKDSDAYSGVLAIKLYGADSVAFAMTTVPVFGDSTYHFSGWAKTPNIVAGSFMLAWLKANQEPIDSVVIIPIIFSPTYRKYTKEIVAPDSAYFVAVNITTLSGMTILADSVTLDGPGWGVEENSKTNHQAKLNISLNPFVQRTVVSYCGLEVGEKIKIYDITGRLVHTLPIPDSQFQISIGEELSPGVYFVKVKGCKPAKIIKLL